MADIKDFTLGETLFTEEELKKRVDELGAQITKDYNGEPLFLIGILKGSVPFMSDLMRRIDLDVEMDFMSVSSYGGSTKSSGIVKIIKDLDTDIKGKNVLIVEDIIDSGLTLSYLKSYLSAKGAKTLKIVTLLDKPSRRKVDIKSDYVGFEIPDKFIVGYGLDVDQKFRHLPYISCIVE